MKYRLGFVTNSSSCNWLVRNMSKETVCGIPAFSTVVAWEGWGDNEGDGDIDQYRGNEKLIISGKEESSFIVLDVTELSEEEFAHAYSDCDKWPYLVSKDARTIKIQDETGFHNISVDLRNISKFHNLERLEVELGAVPKVEDWKPILRNKRIERIHIYQGAKFLPALKYVRFRYRDLWDAIKSLNEAGIQYEMTDGKYYFIHNCDSVEDLPKLWPQIIANWKRDLNKIEKRDHFFAQRVLFMSLQMEELTGYWKGLEEILKSIDDKMPYDEFREAVYDRMIKLLSKQIKRTGKTVLLDVDKIKQTKACILVQDIIEARRKEFENVVIPIVKDTAFVAKFALTAYGFQILSKTGLDVVCDRSQLDIIKSSTQRIGFDLKCEELKEKPDFNLDETEEALIHYFFVQRLRR